MSLLSPKSRLESVVDGVDFSKLMKNAARSTLNSALDGGANGSAADAALKSAKPLRGPRKAGLVLAGGVAGLTAASAAVSAARRRQKEA